MKHAANNWCDGGPEYDAVQFQISPCFMDQTREEFCTRNILPEKTDGRKGHGSYKRRGNIPSQSRYLVSSWSESSCFKCLERSFFSMERRTQARAFPTSVLISLMFWMCLRMETDLCLLKVNFAFNTNGYGMKYCIFLVSTIVADLTWH